MSDNDCALCEFVSQEAPVFGGILWQDDTWILRHLGPGRGLPGWVMLQTKRHVAGIHDFDANELEEFAPLIQNLQRTLMDVTGALRVYLASMNESAPHFHGHLVPRYPEMPLDAVSWKAFDLPRASAAGEYTIDDAESLRICDELRTRFAANSPV